MKFCWGNVSEAFVVSEVTVLLILRVAVAESAVAGSPGVLVSVTEVADCFLVLSDVAVLAPVRLGLDVVPGIVD